MSDSYDNLFTQLQTAISGGNIESALQKTFGFAKLMSYYRCAMMEIETKFNVLNEEYALRFDRQPISNIKTRLKSPISIHEKLRRRDLPATVESIEENLNDVAGIRVICSFIEDVYVIADALVKQDDITLIERKDYIANPKPNGYRSLHLIVAVPIFLQHEKRIMKAEIQIRTIAMDSWASLEHQLRYKKDRVFDESMKDDLRHCAELSAELDAKMDALRGQICTDRYDERIPLTDGVDQIPDAITGQSIPLVGDADEIIKHLNAGKL